MSPQKKPKVDLSKVQFECGTSVSLASDSDHNLKTPSSKKPAAKRIDIKATHEQKTPEIRRSTRPRKSTLATKFGNAIPISQILDPIEPQITVANIQDLATITSTQNDILVNKTADTNPSPQISSQEIIWTEIHMDTAIPEKTRDAGTENHLPPTKISSRYARKTENNRGVVQQELWESYEHAQSISPVRGNSMTFQWERELITQQSQRTTGHSTH